MPLNELTVSFKDLYRRDDVVGHIFHKGLEPRVSPFDFIEHGIEGFDELSDLVFLSWHRDALAQVLRSNLRHARRKRRDGAHHGIDEYCTGHREDHRIEYGGDRNYPSEWRNVACEFRVEIDVESKFVISFSGFEFSYSRRILVKPGSSVLKDRERALPYRDALVRELNVRIDVDIVRYAAEPLHDDRQACVRSFKDELFDAPLRGEIRQVQR